MVTEKKTYWAQFNGQRYPLHLRMSDDGFIPAYEVAAAQSLLVPFITKRLTLPDEFWTDQIYMSRVMNLICEEGTMGGWMKANGELDPLPWRTWFELDFELLQEMVRDFFSRLRGKIERLNPSLSFMTVNLWPAFISASNLLKIESSDSSSSQPGTLNQPTDFGGSEVDTSSSAI